MPWRNGGSGSDIKRGKSAWNTYEEFFDDMVAAWRIPMGWIGNSEEFDNLAYFLASDAASYFTGVSINVDGSSSLEGARDCA